MSSNYNIVQQNQNQFTINASSIEKPKYENNQQTETNPDFYAPNPISNSQANNQGQAYPYNPNVPPQGNYPYNPNMPPQGNYPYNPNIPPQGNYPYNPNMPPNAYPYNPNNPPPQGFPYYNISSESFPNNIETVRPQQLVNPSVLKCLYAMLLIMSLLMFTFLICEIIVLSSIGEAFKNGFVIADEIGILICAILFLVSFILTILKKNIIVLGITRTVITVAVWFVGMPLRGIGTMGDFDHDGTFFALLTIRGFLLFMCIPVSFMNMKCEPTTE